MDTRKPPMSVKELMKKKKGVFHLNTELLTVPTLSSGSPSAPSFSDAAAGHTVTTHPSPDGTNHVTSNFPNTSAARQRLQDEKKAARTSGGRKRHSVSLHLSCSDR